MNVSVNLCVIVNVNVGVRAAVSARVSVSVNVCRGSFKCGRFRGDSRRSVEVDVSRAGPRRLCGPIERRELKSCAHNPESRLTKF